ncbi:MAG: hypothetical protein ACRBN8_07970 [Nannocystales bacterium]
MLPLALLVACGDSTDGSDPMVGDSDSGFTGNSEGTTASDSDNPTDPSGADSSGGSGQEYDTLGEGDLRGTLSFTFFAADAANPEPLLGMAGAWRTADDDIDDVEDFFGVFGLGTQWPTPPADLDTLDQNAVPGTFEWGGPTQWLLAGNGMKLRRDDAEATACLLFYGGSAEVEFPPSSGTMVPNYPVYAATTSTNQPEGCAPDPATWEPSAEYDIVLYGGDLFETNSLAGQVHTPDALEVTSPDVVTFGTQVAMDEDLEVSWTGEAGEDTRLVIRVFDMFGRMFTVNAADDGSYTIPSADLSILTAGPATLIVSREHFEEVPFTDGTVRVLSRYAQWGYIELF